MVLLYHHEIHKKHIKRSNILELQTENGIVKGHEECAKVLVDSIKSFLSDTSPLNKDAQKALLLEVKPVFTEEDYGKLEASPNYEEIKSIVKKANHMATHGMDGIPSLLYHKCFNILGHALTSLIKDTHGGQNPTMS